MQYYSYEETAKVHGRREVVVVIIIRISCK